jgi:hypothetical protein
MMACSSTMVGCSFTVTVGPLDLTSAAMFCSLATLLVDRSLPVGNLGEQVGVIAKMRMGHGPRPGGWRRPWRLVGWGAAYGPQQAGPGCRCTGAAYSAKVVISLKSGRLVTVRGEMDKVVAATG